jgi:subtilisin family serine protease
MVATYFMKKKNYLTIQLLFLLSIMWMHRELPGQNNIKNKLSLQTYRLLQKFQEADMLPVLIKGDGILIQNFVSMEHGIVKYSAGDIVSATVSKHTINQLSTQQFVEFIECPVGKVQPLNDVMLINNNVDSAYYGYWPLEQGEDGTGVIVGIIDAPFDINHGDFKDADGNTRIKYLWDQNLEADGTSPDPYSYGIECDSLSIATGTCPSNDFSELNYSHGTGVAGVAASSGYASNSYRGVAPNADLIFVSLDFTTNFLTNVTDAVQYIFEKADELNKPCVINTSFGTYVGSHDANDLTARIIENLITEKDGRSIVAAAGNAGNALIHLGYNVSVAPGFTWFKSLSDTSLVYFQAWADSADFNDVYFSVAADDPLSGYTFIGTTPDYNALLDFDLSSGGIDSVQFNIEGAGLVNIYIQLINGTYLLEFTILPADPDYYWRFTTHGDGYFDIWSGEIYTGFSDFVTVLPDASTLPEIVNYKMPDTDKTTVSSWQCSDKVITVGSYVNRDTMTNYYHEMPPLIDTVGELFYTSSHGPTREGRIKPDICASGARILSSASSVLTDWLISLDAADYISVDGKHYLYSGTSFASPIVAGIAALYLQKNPDAGQEEIKRALLSQARHDEFTGDDLPNNFWGYGKADAFRTLTGTWGCLPGDYEEAPENLEVFAIMPAEAKLHWEIIPNADKYQVNYMNTLTGEIDKVFSNDNYELITELEPGSVYTCKVRAYCESSGVSKWSDRILFHTPPLRENANFFNSDISVYPNPTSHYINVWGIAGNYSFSIIDITGKNVFDGIVSEKVPVIYLPYLSDGIYQLVLYKPDSVYNYKIFISN